MKETIKYLKPTSEPLVLNGKMMYSDRQRAWGILRLKKELIDEFPQMKERREKLGYKILLCRDLDELENQVAKIRKDVGVSPLLVWFVKE